MEGILYVKDADGNRIPIEHLNNCDTWLDKNKRDSKYMYLKKTKNGFHKDGYKSIAENYKQKALYLLVEGTEFLVKNED